MTLRYYATLKVRKFELLLCKINTFLQKTTTCIGLQVEQIFAVNREYTYFSILGVVFAVPFLCIFPKALASCSKKKLKMFLLHCTSICMSSKSMSQIFKILFQTGNIKIFVFCAVFFSKYV